MSTFEAIPTRAAAAQRSSGEGSDGFQICADQTGWRSQFGSPRGLGGWLAGQLMARKNAPMNRACVALLRPGPEDRVLEIGFGHGRTLAWLARRAGFVAGVDPSPVMLRQASARNRAALRAGRVQLALASASVLPFPDAHFDRALAVNCVQHWDDPGRDLAEVRRVLVPRGNLLLGLRLAPAHPGRFSSPGFTAAQIEAIRAVVLRAGFREVTLHERPQGVAMVGLEASR
jgi:ubiquinone/menaquinone biosynthesis C-methylase UbiE